MFSNFWAKQLWVKTRPLAWVLGYDELDRILPALFVMIGGMPAFVPAALLGKLFGQQFFESQWLAFLLTAVEFVIGVWMMRLGPKRTVAYFLIVMQVSALGSLAFYMMSIACFMRSQRWSPGFSRLFFGKRGLERLKPGLQRSLAG